MLVAEPVEATAVAPFDRLGICNAYFSDISRYLLYLWHIVSQIARPRCNARLFARELCKSAV